MPVPEAIKNAPELAIGLQFYFVAFLDLGSCRSLGQGFEGPIWWTAIDQYANRMELVGERRDDFFYHMAELDKVYLKEQSKRLKEATDKAGSKGKINKKGR
jgi:hypothetical protein